VVGASSNSGTVQEPLASLRGLAIRIAALLTAIGVAVLVGHEVLQQSLTRHIADVRLANAAAIQPMLSERLCKTMLALAVRNDPNYRLSGLSVLRESLLEWQRTHRSMRQGNAALGFPNPQSRSPVVAAQFDVLEGYVQSIESAVQEFDFVIQQDPAASSDKLLAITRPALQAEARYLDAMQYIVAQYELDAARGIEQTKQALRVALLAGLGLILAGGLILLVPAVQRIGGRLRQLLTDHARLQSEWLAADSSNRAKAQFLSNLNDELRTPLHAILGFADLARTEPLDAAAPARQQVSDVAANALLRLFNDLLAVTSLDAGNPVSLNPRRAELVDLVDQCLQLLRPEAEQRAIQLTFSQRPVQLVHVLVDDLRLRQLIMNLLSHMLRIGPSGQVDMRLRATAPNGGVLQATIEIENVQVELSPYQLQRVLDRFNAAFEASVTPDPTGLSLYLSGRIAEAMHGHIDASAVPGGGTTLRLTLPLSVADPQAILGGIDLPTLLRGKAVLIAECERANRALLEDYLSQCSCRLLLAEDGESAWELFQALPQIDAALIGLRLPKLDGLGLVRQIRSWERSTGRNHCPVVGLAAMWQPELQSELVKGGFDVILQIPTGREELLTAFQRAGVSVEGESDGDPDLPEASFRTPSQAYQFEHGLGQVPHLLTELREGAARGDATQICAVAHQLSNALGYLDRDVQQRVTALALGQLAPNTDAPSQARLLATRIERLLQRIERVTQRPNEQEE